MAIALGRRSSSSMAESCTAVLRVTYLGESLRNGRVVPLCSSDSPLPGEAVLQALRGLNIDLRGYVPFFFSRELDGWAPLLPESSITLAPPESSLSGAPVQRVEVRVERRQSIASAPTATEPAGGESGGAVATPRDAVAASDSDGGYFGVGVFQSKHAHNVGTLWRSAHQLGAAFLFTVGTRNTWDKRADTIKVWRKVPAWRYDTWGDLIASAPYQAELVAVEFGPVGGVPLAEFEHPERAIYVLGAEDSGLPEAVVRSCRHCVHIETEREESFNVAVAGSLIMYDRLVKRRRRQAAEVGGGSAAAGEGGAAEGR